MIDLEPMSLAELEAHRAEVEKLIKCHREARKDELVTNLLTAAKALRAEFPYISADIDIRCSQCDCYEDVDLLDYLVEMTSRNFRS
jgi:hypothetical protein